MTPAMTPMGRADAIAIVAAGVSGAGKTSLGACLAEHLGCAFLEGDDYHLAASVDKMRAGTPLEDADRWPWLDRIGTEIGLRVRRGETLVVSCSALKRRYRERLTQRARVPLHFLLLECDRDTLDVRMRARREHYMPATLLDSQLRALELPLAGEVMLRLNATAPLNELCEAALEWLRRTAPGAI